uniref:Uncharacterized protein n=1 Tax=Mustela putorius furo TaxID=9669 RepID=M3XTS3_MUSPF
SPDQPPSSQVTTEDVQKQKAKHVTHRERKPRSVPPQRIGHRRARALRTRMRSPTQSQNFKQGRGGGRKGRREEEKKK